MNKDKINEHRRHYNQQNKERLAEQRRNYYIKSKVECDMCHFKYKPSSIELHKEKCPMKGMVVCPHCQMNVKEDKMDKHCLNYGCPIPQNSQ